jgi:branched-chain amino acid aminotransferase
VNAPAAPPIVWVNGSFVADPATTPAVTALDDGVLVGRGVFETIAIRHGVAFARRRHIERLHTSAAIVGVTLDAALVDTGIDAALSRWGPRDGRLRVTATAGGALIVTADVPREIAPTATLVIAPWPRNERSPLVAAKSTAYADNALAFAYAQAHGATDALFVNTRGEVCEGSRTNVFAVCEGRLVTPPLSAGCLAGVTRALVLDYGAADEATFDTAELMAASEVFITSALRGAQPITAVEGIAIGDAARPHARRVARILAELNADA